MEKNTRTILLYLWFVVGILAFIVDDISKFDYFLVWINLILCYLRDIMKDE